MAKLTYGERKSMPKSDFAVPSARKGGKGGYPIPDKSHARDALSRVSANGSPAVKAEVREKVEKKFPGMVHKGARDAGPPSSHDAFMDMKHGDRYDHSMGRKR